MQQPESANSPDRKIRHHRVSLALFALGALAFGGCGPEPSSANDRPAKPLASVSIKLHCADRAFAEAVTPIVRTWAARTGATVEIVATADANADLLILPANEVGSWAERGELLPIPANVREPGHPYQWGNVLNVYRSERLAGWGGQIIALPLAGEGHVLVYRRDRFDEPIAAYLWQLETDRALSAPATWEEYSELAEFFSRFDGKPALPPLPPDADRLSDHFFRVAASYDRVALGDVGAGLQPGVDTLEFQFHTETGKSRLNERGFEQAAKWLSGLKKTNAFPASDGEPAAALADGKAVMGMLSLSELGRLQQGSGWRPDRFGIASLPGTRSYYDAEGREIKADGNYVPYFSGGRYGVVRQSCKHPDAAFDLLTEVGGPARSLEIVSTPGLGAGPFRNSHLDRDRLLIWLGYGFDETASKTLQESLRANLGLSVRNPVYGLRGPDQAKLTQALGTELKAIGNGSVTPEAGLKRAISSWNELDASVPAEQLRLWRRRAVGLN